MKFEKPDKTKSLPVGKGARKIVIDRSNMAPTSSVFDNGSVVVEERVEVVKSVDQMEVLPRFSGLKTRQCRSRMNNTVIGNMAVNGDALYGRFYCGLNTCAINLLNGFGAAVSSNFYQCAVTPGSSGNPYTRDIFLVSFASATASNQRVRLLSPAIRNESFGLCLAVNGIAQRPLILLRGNTYVFMIQKVTECQQGDSSYTIGSGNAAELNFGCYFTLDPIGGNARNAINTITGTSDPCGSVTAAATSSTTTSNCCNGQNVGYQPEIIGQVLYPGTPNMVYVSEDWPTFGMWLQCFKAPFMGVQLLILDDVSSVCCNNTCSTSDV